MASKEPVAALVANDDIDINGHVNGIRYIEHILDLFDRDGIRKRIRRFEMAYVAGYYGDELTLFMDDAGEGVLRCEIEKWQRSGLSLTSDIYRNK